MHVVTVPSRTDNFSYLVSNGATDAVAVDPCDGDTILQAVRARGYNIQAILCTHHHHDHVGGNRALLAAFPKARVYAHVRDKGRIPGQTQFIEHEDCFTEAGLRFRALFVPGHTRAHVAYCCDSAVFVGDTLFGAGCGRLFEGTPEMMEHSLNHVLAALPDDTLAYFAHEYTAANLRFALSLEPDHPELLARMRDVTVRRAAGEWTTPTTIGEEKRTNPFLRSSSLARLPEIRDALGGQASPAQVFAHVRGLKDRF